MFPVHIPCGSQQGQHSLRGIPESQYEDKEKGKENFDDVELMALQKQTSLLFKALSKRLGLHIEQ